VAYGQIFPVMFSTRENQSLPGSTEYSIEETAKPSLKHRPSTAIRHSQLNEENITAGGVSL
jgi:hypothetical protein